MDGATSLGVFRSGQPFGNSDHLWRCNECDGLFVGPDQLLFVVGMISHDATLGKFSAKWWEKEDVRLRHNLELAATYRDSAKCRCRDSDDGHGCWEVAQKELDEFIIERAKWQSSTNFRIGESDA